MRQDDQDDSLNGPLAAEIDAMDYNIMQKFRHS